MTPHPAIKNITFHPAAEIEVGTRVAYSRNFCRSTGQLAGAVPHARGTVTHIHTFAGSDVALATVAWDDRGRFAGERMPRESKVNIRNLVREDRIHLQAQ